MIDVVEHRLLVFTFEPLIANVPPDDRIVLLLDKTVVVFPVGPRTRKGDLLALAISVQLMVDELRSVVRIDAEQGKRHPRSYLL